MRVSNLDKIQCTCGSDAEAITPIIEQYSNGTISLGAIGYSDVYDSNGGPIVQMENVEGKLMLYVWADINLEEPTHVIDLSAAKVTNAES